MKQRSTEQTFIRMLIAENIVQRRKAAREIRDYALYDLSKRKIRSICANTEYLKILIKRMEELEKENSNLFLYYIKTKGV